MKLTELTNKIGKSLNPMSTYMEEVYIHMRDNPDEYELCELGYRNETLTLGEHTIPKKGEVITYVDNEFFDLQELEFKTIYPELDQENSAAIAEIVRYVKLKNESEIDIEIVRYLIGKK